MIYLDNAATSLPKPPSVQRAVSWAMQRCASPGRGTHEAAQRASRVLLDCRLEAAEFFSLEEPEQVVFCFNATHALNLAIFSLLRPGDRVLISGFEHNAVTRPLHALGARLELFGTRLFDDEALLKELEEKLPGAKAVVCTCVSNVFGAILPYREIARRCRETRTPLILDASQAAGVLPLDFRSLGAEFMAMPGHKGLFGPQGTGLLLCRAGTEPLLFGGSGSDSLNQEMPGYLPDRLEAGTHNVPGVAGLLEGLRYVKSAGTEAIFAHEAALMRLLREELGPVEALECFFGPEERQSGVLSFRCRHGGTDALAEALGARGLCLRSGLHCAPLAHQSAGTLSTGTIRLSLSPFVSERELLSACRVIREESEKVQR